MLSKTDIQKELGKGICLFPLNLDNINGFPKIFTTLLS